MFNTPITGLSFIANAFIVFLGVTINLVRRRPIGSVIISQKHILKMERSPIGSWITSIVAVLMPLFIFIASGTLTGYGLYELYSDSSRISAVDVAKSGAHLSVRGFEYTADKIAGAQFDGVSFKRVEALEGEVTTSTLSAMVEASSTSDYHLEINDAFDSMAKTWANDTSTATTGLLLFPKGREHENLFDFMKANNLPTTLEVRKSIASFFGLEDYNGTKSQNIFLREKLGEITVDHFGRSITGE